MLEKTLAKILYALDSDSRQSYAEIARHTGLSEDIVRYRIGELEKDGTVLKFHSAIDTAKLGLAMYELYFKLHSADENKIQEITRSLCGEKSVTWVAELEGGFDIGIALRVRTINDLSDLLDRILGNYNSFISARVLQVVVNCEYLPRDYLLGKNRSPRSISHYQASQEAVSIDEIDRQILKLLGTHSRFSAAEIARKLEEQQLRAIPLSREAVLLRIKKLERLKLINGYTIALNHTALNLLHYKVLLYFNHVALTEIERFLGKCRQHSNVTYLVKSLGQWDYELDLEVESVNQYRSIMSQLLREHPHAIRDHTSFIIVKIHKYTTATAY